MGCRVPHPYLLLLPYMELLPVASALMSERKQSVVLLRNVCCFTSPVGFLQVHNIMPHSD